VDLIVHNWNPKAPLVIASSIVNNIASNRVLNLVHTGDGTTVLSGANSYTGDTYVQGGVLRLDSAGALPANSHLRLDGGVLGLNAGDFTRGLGTGATQVGWTSGGGFAAYTTNRTVNLGGSGALVTWGAGGFVLDNTSFILGAQDANKTLIFANGIDLGRKDRMFEVISGSSSTYVDARLSGVLEGEAGHVIKAGNGVLELAAVNTYMAGTSLAEGTLVGVNNGAFGSGLIKVGTSTDTRSSGMALNLVFQGSTLANAMKFGNVNGDGISVLATSASTTTVSSGIELGRVAGGNVMLLTANTTSANYQGVISGTGGITLLGGGTVTLSGVNTYGSLTEASSSAANGGTVVRNGTLIVSNASSLGVGSTLELGDATIVLANANFATAGSSLLGVERSLSNAVENVGSLGGFFESTGGGLISLSGSLNSGPGAFYRVSRVIDGVTFGSADIGKTILVKDEADKPERNGVYSIIQVNDDLTINLVRVADFSSTTNMRYGAQVTVTSGTQSGQTFFMAAPDVAAVNGGDANPVHWVQDKANPDVTFQVSNAAITSVTQAIDVNANGSGATTIVSATPVTFTNSVTLQDIQAGVRETKTLTINSGTSAGSGIAFNGIISESDGGTTVVDDILSLLKTGTGVATLTGANTYGGTTTISSGTLMVNNPTGSGTGSSAVTVQSGATLSGSGSIAPSNGNDINVLSGANLSVGTTGSLVAQTLTINLQTGSDLNLGGRLRLDLLLNQSNVTCFCQNRHSGRQLVWINLGGICHQRFGSRFVQCWGYLETH
jgi:autotransporter-associated beta strand protein